MAACLRFGLDVLHLFGFANVKVVPGHPPGRLHGRARGVGRRRGRHPARARSGGHALRGGRGRRRLLRPEDRPQDPRRHRPRVAVHDLPARLPDARALRAGIRRVGRLAPASDHDPPRAARLDRALHRRAHRALRRRLPDVAGPGAGARDHGQREGRGLWPRGREHPARRRAARRRRSVGRQAQREDPARPAGEDPVHAGGGRAGHGGARGVAADPRRQAAARGAHRRVGEDLGRRSGGPVARRWPESSSA